MQTAVTPTVPAAASPAFRASAPAAQPVQTAVKATVRVAASPAFRASASSGGLLRGSRTPLDMYLLYHGKGG